MLIDGSCFILLGGFLIYSAFESRRHTHMASDVLKMVLVVTEH